MIKTRRELILEALELQNPEFYYSESSRHNSIHPRASGRTTRMLIEVIESLMDGNLILIQAHSLTYSTRLSWELGGMLRRLNLGHLSEQVVTLRQRFLCPNGVRFNAGRGQGVVVFSDHTTPPRLRIEPGEVADQLSDLFSPLPSVQILMRGRLAEDLVGCRTTMPHNDALEVLGDLSVAGIGDPSCLNNAWSPYLQCAVNPTGDCNDCPHFERRLDRHEPICN